jgi:hypothetical protein
MNKLKKLIALCGGLLILGCVGDGVGVDASGKIPQEGPYVAVQAIFTTKCTTCHSAGHSTGLNLTDGNSYDLLVNVASTSSKKSINSVRVVPGSPEESLLYWALQAENEYMPQGGPYSDADAEVIRKWIADGAQQ